MINKLFGKYIKQEADKLKPQLKAEILAEMDKKNAEAWKENCDFLFEADGHTYHKYKDHKVIPLQRLKYIHAVECLLDSKLNNSELDHLIEIGLVNAEKATNSVKQSNRIEFMDKVYWAFQEMKDRKQRLMFHPTLLIELAAYTIIRDDEKPEEVNMAIHQQKIELFKTKGGDIPFLLQGGIGKALIKPEKYLENIAALWDITKSEVEYEASMYEKILTSSKLATT